jgi:hypothetical protein
LGGMKEGGKKARNMSKTSSKDEMRVPASFMSVCVRPSAYTPLLTWKPLKTSG